MKGSEIVPSRASANGRRRKSDNRRKLSVAAVTELAPPDSRVLPARTALSLTLLRPIWLRACYVMRACPHPPARPRPPAPSQRHLHILSRGYARRRRRPHAARRTDTTFWAPARSFTQVGSPPVPPVPSRQLSTMPFFVFFPFFPFFSYFSFLWWVGGNHGVASFTPLTAASVGASPLLRCSPPLHHPPMFPLFPRFFTTFSPHARVSPMATPATPRSRTPNLPSSA